MSEGKKEILLGDCLELMKDIPNGSVDMILCDLPYGTTACKWDTIIPFDKLWEQYERIIKPTGAIVLTASQPFTSLLINSNINAYRHIWYWKKSRPTGFQRVSQEPLRTIEDVVVFYRDIPYNEVKTTEQMISFKIKLSDYFKSSGLTLKQLNIACGFEASGYFRKSSSWKNVTPTEEKLKVMCDNMNCSFDELQSELLTANKSISWLMRTFNPQGIRSCSKKNKRGATGENWHELANNHYDVEFENYPTNIIEILSEGKPLHPTQKPIALFEYLIKTYTNEGDLVLDNTAGSGTTAIACLNTNRQFIVMEKEQKYYDIILKRVGDFNKNFEPQTLFGNEM